MAESKKLITKETQMVFFQLLMKMLDGMQFQEMVFIQ